MQFSERKVAQMAAYLLSKAGGRMPHLKLMKLLYLADRESFDRYDQPITGDHMVSMPHGPVLSETLDLINGASSDHAGGWNDWVSDRANYEVSLANASPSVDRSTLGALSDADLEIVDAIWERFGGMSKWELRDWTHEHCSEWSDPHGSATPIPYADVLVALGRDLGEAKAIAEDIEDRKVAYGVLASI